MNRSLVAARFVAVDAHEMAVLGAVLKCEGEGLAITERLADRPPIDQPLGGERLIEGGKVVGATCGGGLLDLVEVDGAAVGLHLCCDGDHGLGYVLWAHDDGHAAMREHVHRALNCADDGRRQGDKLTGCERFFGH